MPGGRRGNARPGQPRPWPIRRRLRLWAVKRDRRGPALVLGIGKPVAGAVGRTTQNSAACSPPLAHKYSLSYLPATANAFRLAAAVIFYASAAPALSWVARFAFQSPSTGYLGVCTCPLGPASRYLVVSGCQCKLRCRNSMLILREPDRREYGILQQEPAQGQAGQSDADGR